MFDSIFGWTCSMKSSITKYYHQQIFLIYGPTLASVCLFPSSSNSKTYWVLSFIDNQLNCMKKSWKYWRWMKCSVGIQTRNNKIAGAEVQTDCSNRTLLLYKLAKDRLHNFRTVVSEEDVHFWWSITACCWFMECLKCIFRILRNLQIQRLQQKWCE